MPNLLLSVLFWLSQYDAVLFHNIVESIFAFGSPGSGKTSSLLKNLLLPMMLAKHAGKWAFSFLIHCCKPDELEQYTRIAAMADRPVKVLSIDGNETWDPIHYEFAHRNDPEAAIETLNSLMTASKPVTSHSGSERFFEGGAERAERASIVLLHAAGHVVNALSIAEMMSSLPTSVEQFHDPEYQQRSRACQVLKEIPFADLPPAQQEDVNTASDHLFEEFPRNDPRTTGSIVMSFLYLADSLRYGQRRKVFCSGAATFRPEDIVDDRQVLIANFPTNVVGPQAAKQYHVMVRQPFTRAVLRRKINPDTHIVVNWVDEAQLCILPPADGTSRENAVLQIARSQRLSTVFISQSVANIEGALGGTGPIGPNTHALLGNFGTKLFFQQNEELTNKYAADLIGKHWTGVESQGISSHDVNFGSQQQHIHVVPPETFTKLQRPDSKNPVAQAIVHMGKVFEATRTKANPEGRTHLVVEFER